MGQRATNLATLPSIPNLCSVFVSSNTIDENLKSMIIFLNSTIGWNFCGHQSLSRLFFSFISFKFKEHNFAYLMMCLKTLENSALPCLAWNWSALSVLSLFGLGPFIIFSCRSQLLDECRLGACYWLSWPGKQISVCAVRFILSHYTNGLDTQDKFACLSITACLTDSISPKVR